MKTETENTLTFKNIDEKLFYVQQHVEKLDKNKKIDFNRSYAELPHILQIITPILRDCRLRWNAISEDKEIPSPHPDVMGIGRITVIVTDIDTKEQLTSSWPLYVNRYTTGKGGQLFETNTMQGVGAARTFVIRYGLCSLLGLHEGYDSDAEECGGGVPKNAIKPNAYPPLQKPKTINAPIQPSPLPVEDDLPMTKEERASMEETIRALWRKQSTLILSTDSKIYGRIANAIEHNFESLTNLKLNSMYNWIDDFDKKTYEKEPKSITPVPNTSVTLDDTLDDLIH